MLVICGSMFKLPPDDDRLSLIEMDAMDFVMDEDNRDTIDALQADLYDATEKGPILDKPEFYSACAACLTDNGVMTVNLFGDHPSYTKNLKAMMFAFDDVWCLPEVHDGNVIAIAFKTAWKPDFTSLYERAAEITAETKLPEKSWVNGIKAWCNEH